MAADTLKIAVKLAANNHTRLFRFFNEIPLKDRATVARYLLGYALANGAEAVFIHKTSAGANVGYGVNPTEQEAVIPSVPVVVTDPVDQPMVAKSHPANTATVDEGAFSSVIGNMMGF
ncbi:MAG: hypothetical protein CTY16_12900 [Methylobacter sp.]|nr:MAG: hypothetical protein CTY16_12900 [Methylobacter sp.]